MALLEGEFYILNEKARAGLPHRVGERCLLTDIYYSSPNYDYLIEFDDGDTSPVKESELNKLTEEDNTIMSYIFKNNYVIYAPTNEEVRISKCDYLHGQVEIDFMDGSSITTGFETLRAKEVDDLPFVEEVKNDELGKFAKLAIEIGQFTDVKNKQYGSSVDATYEMTKALMERYTYDDDYYLMPKSLLKHLLLNVRIMDKQNRIFNNPTGKGDSESPYKDITGYGIIGVDMVENAK
jgi:hypothetical protein